MKIAFLNDDFPPQSFGGAGISTYELARGMREAGHDVSVITTCRKESEAGECDYDGLKVFKIASDYPSRWRWYVSLYNRPVVQQIEKLLKKIRPDIVHVNNVHFYLSYRSIKVAKRYARAVVMTFRDVMSFNFAKLQTKKYLEHFDYKTTWLDHLKQTRKRWNPFRNFCIKKYLKYPDKLFAVSATLKEALQQNDIGNVEVIHTGADVAEWRTTQEEATLYKNKYGLENKKVVLFGGRLSDAKGGRQVLEAMVMVADEFPEAVLVIAASIDGQTEEMKKEATKKGIGNKLIFTGWAEREDMKYLYACADIVLVPSTCFDSFPRVVLEAMAVGRPVIGTRYGGAPEIIEDGVTGYVVNPFDVDSISANIIDLLHDTEKAKRFGEAGHERVRADFNLKTKVEEYVAWYQRLINHGH